MPPELPPDGVIILELVPCVGKTLPGRLCRIPRRPPSFRAPPVVLQLGIKLVRQLMLGMISLLTASTADTSQLNQFFPSV